MSRPWPGLVRSLGRRRAEIELKWMRQTAASDAQLVQMVDRRTRGEPLQYILGTQPFGPLDIIVRPPVLIPRPETEQWTYTLADTIARRLVPSDHPQSLTVLDLCTGTGCIPLLLCTLLSRSGIQTKALGVDISPAACLLARENVMSSQPRLSPLVSVRIIQKDLFEPDFWCSVRNALSTTADDRKSPPQVSIITANPPYIPARDWHRLSPEVKDWEDPMALISDPAAATENVFAPENLKKDLHGLRFYRHIHHLVSTCTILSPSCVLALEIGENQASAVAGLFHDQFQKIEVWKDIWGKDRAVFCATKR